MRNKKNRYLIVVVLLILTVVGVGANLFVQAGREITRFEQTRPLPGAVLYDQNGQVIKRLGTGSVFVSLDKVPKDLQNAVLSSHNKEFYKEQGWEKQSNRGVSAQIAKQILEPKGMWAKLKLAILPTVLERRYSERELLEMYLNQSYFGEGAYGIEAASQTYFAKHIDQIDLAQSALLAGLAHEPEQASPYKHPDRAQKLRNSILLQMQKNGYIDKGQQEQATNTMPKLERHEPGQAHYFSDYLSSILVDTLGEDQVFQGGLKVETTLNLQLQKFAERIFEKNNLEGGLVAIDPKQGQILAMVGGLNYLEDKTNLATSKQKDVGTTLRPLIYATGLKEDWAMNHLVEDIQRKFNDYEVKNKGDRYWGTVTMKHALALELNNAAIWTLNKLGLNKFTDFAQSVGLKLKEEDQNLSLAMGQLENGISLLELTTAYLPAVMGGLYAPASGYVQIENPKNKNITKNTNDALKRILSEQQAYLLTNMLMANTEYGSINNLDVDFPAVLTASWAQDKSSQWAIGYTPTLLAGIYVKTPNSKEEKETSELLAGQIWVEFMEKGREEMGKASFEIPKDIETDILIDVFTGLLGSNRCPQVELDAFIKGTKPTQTAPCAIPPPPIVKAPVPAKPPAQQPAAPEVPQAPPVAPPPPQTPPEAPPSEPILPEEPLEPTEPTTPPIQPPQESPPQNSQGVETTEP